MLYSINQNNSVIPKVFLFEDSIFDMQSNQKRGKCDSEQMDYVVILNYFDSSEEVNCRKHCNKQKYRVSVDSSRENLKKHE